MSTNTKVRPLSSQERGSVFSAGLALGAFFADRLPFFNGGVSELNEQGLLPAGIAYMAGLVPLGWFRLW
ncbi:hypothetical protein PUN71_022790 [Arthrobacter sp. NQ7]|uniref:hypothetical protein n=1 Tax=Arthrobacter sp. NQ7 TaxID=3032303 RepID=UPI002410A7CF|nr:hypothetical protein [Arthrobacter sp. NQ7]MDJ0460041.1 hypothetical protein [Arthrobacter sp. NQ7]